MKIGITNPCRWLLEQLPHFLDAETHGELMASYAEQQRRYGLAVKIRQTRREIASFERIMQIRELNDAEKHRLEKRRQGMEHLEAEMLAIIDDGTDFSEDASS